MSSHQSHTQGEYIPETYIPKAESHGTKSLWKVFLFLLFVTIVDFVIYFVVDAGIFRNLTFVALGIVKAYYIIGVFMHLKFEAKFLRYMIILPAIVFLSYFVWFLLVEGNYVNLVKYVL